MVKDERPWGAVDLGLPTNRKLRGADGRAKWLYASTMLWCGSELNDGVFEPRLAVAVADVPARYVKDLIDRNLWHEKGHACPSCPQPAEAGELVVHDYLRHNTSAEKVRKMRAERAAAGRAANHKRWKLEGPIEECEVCNE